MTKRLPKARFDLYALGTRDSSVRLFLRELSYWADDDERVIGTVLYDLNDGDYGWIMLSRDPIGCFRSIGVDHSLPSARFAERSLKNAIRKTSRRKDIDTIHFQKVEDVQPLDVLSVAPYTDTDSLHPYFKHLLEHPSRAPSRAVIREIAPWLAPSDPHFVEEFQRHHFDQRLWELYLWASFRELGFDVRQLVAPDFACTAPYADFTVEATTTAPSTTGPLANHPNPQTLDEIKEFVATYMPLKFGSSLFSKLQKVHADGKHYWEMEDAKDKPFVLAIADFHQGVTQDMLGSMVYTQSALWMYLYGVKVDWEVRNGNVVFMPSSIETHRYGEKTISSGFFNLPEAQNISAVLFSNAGTLSKFDRIGVVAGFGAPNHKYIRIGERFNPDPNAVTGIPFVEDVSDPGYEEHWSDELQIFHNPNAVIPLPPEWFDEVNQTFFEDGNLYDSMPEANVLHSYTNIFQLLDEKEFELLKRKGTASFDET